MRIFTLGKNGIPLFFFALILFSGTYSSYGQECPTVDADDSTQYFCDAEEAEIGDLVVTSGTDVVWYESQTATDPLPLTGLLVNGRTYYAGTANDDCLNNRAEVTVNVASQPVILGLETSFDPNSSTKQSVGGVTTIGVCVADTEDPGVTVGDLRTNVDNTGNVRWYSSRTSTTPLSLDTPLEDETSYFAALYSAEGDCETNRSGVTIQLYSEQAPTAAAEQSFCGADNPTLADIVASGENNYYRTATSVTELSANTPLIDGRTYYLSTVGMYCESFERTPVTVDVVQELTTNSISTEVCSTRVTNPTEEGFTDFYLNLITSQTDLPETGTFNPPISELVRQYNEDSQFGEFRTEYTATNACGEDTVEVVVNITEAEAAEAGSIENIVVACDETDVIILDDTILSSEAVTGGVFTAAEGVLNADGNFDPAIGAGEYTITYTVDSRAGCIAGEESTTFTITVEPSAYAGEDTDLVFCQAEFQPIIELASTDPQAAEEMLLGMIGENVDTDGTFSSNLQQIAMEYYAAVEANDFPFTASTTYTVGDGTACEDSAEISLTINEGEEAQDIYDLLCNERIDNPTVSGFNSYFRNLVQSAGLPRTGTFEPSMEALVDQYNDNPLGEFTSTYSVDTECGPVQIDVTVDIVQNQDANAGEIQDQTVACDATEVIVLANLVSAEATQGGTFTAEEDVLDENGNFDPSVVGPGEYTITYTVDNSIPCVTGSDSTTFTVTVNEGDIEANAGEIEDITVACPTAGVVVLNNSLLSEGAIQGGTFTADEGVLDANGNFDPSIGTGEYTITYIVDESVPCVTGTDSTSFTVTVNDETIEANAGEIADISVACAATEVVVLNDSLLSEDAVQGGTFTAAEGVLDANGNFDPSIGAGEYTITYTVDESVACVTGTDSTSFTITVTEGAAEVDDIYDLLCNSRINNPTVSGFNSYFRNLVERVAGLPRTGTFAPSMETLVNQYENNPLGEFTTTYSVDTECGPVAIEVTVNIVQNQVANAGEIDDITVACDASEVVVLDNSILAEDATPGGTFTAEGDVLDENGNFNPTVGPGVYTITYTVDNSAPCVTGTDSTTFTITVNDGTTEADAGEIEDMTAYCAAGEVIVLDESLLSEGATQGGTFTADEGVLDANGNFDASIGAGEYTITYTVGESNACVTGTDSTSFTITVVEGDVELDPIFNELCSTRVDNPTVSGFTSYFRNLVSQNTNLPLNGTFSPEMADLVAQYENEPIGTFVSSYTVTTDCGDATVEVSVQINAPEDANAGEDITAEFCVAQDEDIELTSLLPEGAQTTGSFSAPYEDGTFNPSVAGLGEYVITYTVVESDCVIGEDSATITITVTDTAEAPVADDVTFCVAEGATVGELVATGDNIRWYTDAELNAPADEDDVLVAGTYYVTQTTAGGCESEAAEVTVTLTDAATPTLVEGGNVFCESDRPTIAELSSNIEESGTVTWYDAAIGGEAYSSSDLLQHGATYYASLADATTQCESAQRLAVTVTLETCELLIPEAFSPNGDGVNETFEILRIGDQYPNYTIEIFNRWGNVVYRGNANTPFWNGESTESRTLGSNVLPVGVYFYILNYNDGQTAPTQGRVYLSR